MKVSVLDYQMGNIKSVTRKLDRLGAKWDIINDSSGISKAEKILLPGVGHFGRAMEYLEEKQLVNILNKKVLENKTPILGICLGMQLMCSYSEEGNVKGLGWFDARVERFKVKDTLRYKIPHTGWNATKIKNTQALMKESIDNEEFYFVHSYCVKSAPEDQIMTITNYETDFVSSLFKNNIYGVQFHPEKSHEMGEELIKNFLKI